jgi:hypothetical protein
MYEILRTNLCEVTFLDGEVKDVYLVSPVSILSVRVQPRGRYSFEIVEKHARRKEILEACFRAPYFEIENYEEYTVRLLPYGIDCLDENTVKIKGAIRTISNDGALEVFIMYGTKDGKGVHCLSAMPAALIAQTIIGMMDNDSNLETAMQVLLMNRTIKELKPILEEAALTFATPHSNTPN